MIINNIPLTNILIRFETLDNCSLKYIIPLSLILLLFDNANNVNNDKCDM